MRTDILRLLAAFALALSLAACSRDNSYRVTERIDRYVDKDGRALDGNPPPDYDHDEIHFVLTHNGRKIHAVCDLSTLDKLDPNASCGLRPLRSYECSLGKAGRNEQLPLSDLICKDADSRKVYLYVSKEE